MNTQIRKYLCIAALIALSLVGTSCSMLHSHAAVSNSLPLTGIAMSGGEWYDPSKSMDPEPNVHNNYPTSDEFKYFKSKGMNVFRVCFLWETIQPKPMKPLDPVQLAYLKQSVDAGTDTGAVIILDPHNYARYYGKVVGTTDVPSAYFSDFWKRMAVAFKDNPHVWFGLVNEPHDLPAQMWLGDANDAIKAIRSTGSKNKITVPGIQWSGAGSWFATWYGGTPNASFMLGIKDPDDNWIYEVHSYLDSDMSGTHPQVVSATIGVERLQQFTEWCRANHKKAILGETATAQNDLSQQATLNEINYMEANKDVWRGWLWWAAGKAWSPDDMYSLEPTGGKDKPQMAWLEPHLQPH